MSKKCPKCIPHHLIKGPCKNCLVRATCLTRWNDLCADFIIFYNTCNKSEKYELDNYITNTPKFFKNAYNT